MSKVIKNIVVRAVKIRMAAGETFENIVKSYPRLSKSEVEEIKKEI